MLAFRLELVHLLLEEVCFPKGVGRVVQVWVGPRVRESEKAVVTPTDRKSIKARTILFAAEVDLPRTTSQIIVI